MLKKDSRYFRLGLTLLTVIIVSVLFGVTLINIGTVFSVVKKIISTFSFVIYGIIFAYLMNPLQRLFEKLIRRLLAKSNMTERGVKKLSRTVSVLLSLLIFILLIYGLLAMVLPELWKSITETFSPENLQMYYEKITAWLSDTLKGSPFEDWLRENDPVKVVQDWLTKELDIFSTIGSVVTEAYGIGKVIFNMVIGLVVSVYLLMQKEKYIAQAKKFVVAIFKQRGADKVFEIGRLTNKSFGGFMVGKVIDSLIIGALSYIGMIILGLPYALISSVFIGLTNIIPFFGPLIGIVIGGVLILLQSPIQALYFLIFELALQQIDGNIIGPRILGGRLGISDFWVLVSITVFGTLFGFGGMLLGVPVFTVIYTLVSQAITGALRKKQLPESTDCYYSILAVEDLNDHEKNFGEATTFFSGDTFETEYDPDDDFEYEDASE
jgi:predicted PurR-regulated permease PerM